MHSTPRIQSTTPGRLRLAAACAFAALLTACGGGGGGDDSVADPVLPAATAITAANAEGVARQSLVAASYLGDTTGLVTGVQVAPGPGALLAFSRAQLLRLPQRLAAHGAVAAGVTTSRTEPCSGGGSVTYTETDNNGNGLPDPGDGAHIAAQACVEDGGSFSGSMRISIGAVSGNFETDTYSLAATVVLENLRAASQAGNVSGSGRFSLAIDSTDANTASLTLNVSSLAVSGSFGGVSDTLTMQGVTLATSTALSGGRLRTSTSISGQVGSPMLAGGSVTLATLQPLVQFDGDAAPTGGQIRATGAGGSQLRLTVQPNADVLLELDADGDGVFETRTQRTWASLV